MVVKKVFQHVLSLVGFASNLASRVTASPEGILHERQVMSQLGCTAGTVVGPSLGMRHVLAVDLWVCGMPPREISQPVHSPGQVCVWCALRCAFLWQEGSRKAGKQGVRVLRSI
jgi:hypothetical protein